MGWSIGYDAAWDRDVGYGVPAWCDQPDCDKEIDRGLSYVCGDQPYGGDHCGLYFCEQHLGFEVDDLGHIVGPQRCDRCLEEEAPFHPKPDHPMWINHKLTDESWAQWRNENPGQVDLMRSRV